ncbi:hypothetical protein B0G81_7702, partial [Paraburkholderia sp. BL6665CI2N2]
MAAAATPATCWPVRHGVYALHHDSVAVVEADAMETALVISL